jgi:hypothetical protein
MQITRLRTRGVLLAAVPVIAIGVAGAGVLTAAHADEPKDGGVQAERLGQKLHQRHGQDGARASARAAPSVLGDWNGDGRADIMARDTAGKLWLYPGTGQAATPYHARRQIGSGWQIYTALVRHGDWNADGKQDLLARDAQGVLWYYKATGAATGSGHYARTRVGGGWQIYRNLVGVDDWDNDGLDDLIAVDAAGKLWMYSGKGTGANFFTARREIGHGWQTYDALTAYGDFTGDGGAELVARDRSGYLWGYTSTDDPAKPYSVRELVDPENGYEVFNAIAGTGDLSAGGTPDLLLRDRAGALYLVVPETGDALIVGRSGWNIYNILL